MIQSGGCTGFLLKTVKEERFRSQFGRQKLQRDVTAKTGIKRQIDVAHSPCPKFPDYSIGAELSVLA